MPLSTLAQVTLPGSLRTVGVACPISLENPCSAYFSTPAHTHAFTDTLRSTPVMSKHLVRCPNGHLGRIDDDQLNGDVSLDCQGGGYEGDDECDFHGWITDDGVEVVEEDSNG